jgi:hypothetical protein
MAGPASLSRTWQPSSCLIGSASDAAGWGQGSCLVTLFHPGGRKGNGAFPSGPSQKRATQRDVDISDVRSQVTIGGAAPTVKPGISGGQCKSSLQGLSPQAPHRALVLLHCQGGAAGDGTGHCAEGRDEPQPSAAFRSPQPLRIQWDRISHSACLYTALLAL